MNSKKRTIINTLNIVIYLLITGVEIFSVMYQSETMFKHSQIDTFTAKMLFGIFIAVANLGVVYFLSMELTSFNDVFNRYLVGFICFLMTMIMCDDWSLRILLFVLSVVFWIVHISRIDVNANQT